MISFIVTALFPISVFTSLFTEGAKKVLSDKDISCNILAGIISVILSLFTGIAYILLTDTAFGVSAVIYIIILVGLSWLCAMVGYDKVIQTISQLGGD